MEKKDMALIVARTCFSLSKVTVRYTAGDIESKLMQHFSLDGEALKHLNDDLNKQNPVMQRSQAIVVAYSSPLFSANMLANLFKKTVASGAVLPVVVHTRGVKLPCSISQTRCPYSRRFFGSCCLCVDDSFWF